MSLATTASLWTNEDSTPKKRIPSMRRTARKTRENDDISIENDNTPLIIDNKRPHSFEEEQQLQDSRADRVSQLINDMSNLTEQNDGNQLVDFNPLSPPTI